jgi:hypothetical protein
MDTRQRLSLPAVSFCFVDFIPLKIAAVGRIASQRFIISKPDSATLGGVSSSD